MSWEIWDSLGIHSPGQIEGLDTSLLKNGWIDTSWGNCFQERTALNLVTWSSDHHPILMEVLEKGKGMRYIQRTFQRIHYEDIWSSYERCQEIVKRE